MSTVARFWQQGWHVDANALDAFLVRDASGAPVVRAEFAWHGAAENVALATAAPALQAALEDIVPRYEGLARGWLQENPGGTILGSKYTVDLARGALKQAENVAPLHAHVPRLPRA